MDVYDRLQEKLASHPLGAPPSDTFLKILRILFTPAEAEMATHLGFWPSPSTGIASAANLPDERVVELCESLAAKGVIYGFQVRGERRYCLLPSAPGLFEYPFMVKGNEDALPEDKEHLGRLWEEYYHQGWARELSPSPTPIARVLPVGEAIQTGLKVFPFEEAARYIEEARYIGLSDCPCRTSKPSCDAPVDVCITFNYSAKFLSERNAARLITPGEALNVLRRSEEAGLVHCATNTADRIDYICNCCPCCCDILGVMTRLPDSSARVESNVRAQVDAGECLACGTCVARCPVEAIELDAVALVDQMRCIGCGLCATACPDEAITLVRVSDTVPPAGYRELLTQIGAEKGRLEEFARHLYPA